MKNQFPDFKGGWFCLIFASMNTFEETAGLCALNRIFGFEPKTAHAIITHIGNATDIFKMPHSDIVHLLGTYSRHTQHINPKALENAKRELEGLSSYNTTFIGCTDRDYPAQLKECEDHPIGLYIRSDTSPDILFAPEKKIAVIGTRDLSAYGREWCRRIVDELGRCKERPIIVSGLALGTDICAHTAATEAGLPTIGVMATGADIIYPHRHRKFAEGLISTPGSGLITDYPPGTAPLPIHFLRRNRIIAGLCDATILIESKVRGGGMMTARLAFSYNRDVYALPGRVDDIRSQGCNILIRERIAETITGTGPLLSGLGITSGMTSSKTPWTDILQKAYNGSMGQDRIAVMTRMMTRIRKSRDITIEELAIAEDTDYSTACSIARTLESDGFISIDLMQRCCANTLKYE